MLLPAEKISADVFFCLYFIKLKEIKNITFTKLKKAFWFAKQNVVTEYEYVLMGVNLQLHAASVLGVTITMFL